MTRFTSFTGYHIDSLKNQRSEEWTPLFSALATNRMELVTFIMSTTTQSFEDLFRFKGLHMLNEDMESHVHDFELRILFEVDAQQGFKYYL